MSAFVILIGTFSVRLVLIDPPATWLWCCVVSSSQVFFNYFSSLLGLKVDQYFYYCGSDIYKLIGFSAIGSRES